MLIAAAGALAERRAGFNPAVALRGARGDLALVRDDLTAVAAEHHMAPRAFWDQLEREVRKALKEPGMWGAVEG